MLMASPSPSERDVDQAAGRCSEPGCEATAHAKGLCRRCYDARYYAANRARLLASHRRRERPAVVRPFTIGVGCVSCGHRFTAPAAAVGVTIPCPRCGRTLRPVLELPGVGCAWCGELVPASAQKGARFCSARCLSADKAATAAASWGRKPQPPGP